MKPDLDYIENGSAQKTCTRGKLVGFQLICELLYHREKEKPFYDESLFQ